MRLFRNTFWVLATSIAGMPIYFVTSIILARFLSVEDRGLYGLAVAAVALTALLAELGWGPATIFRLRRAGAPPGRVVSAALVAVALISVVVIAIGLAFEDGLRSRFLTDAPLWVFHLVLAAVPLQILWVVFASIARGIDRFALQNGFQLFLHAGRLLAMAVLLVALGGALRQALSAHVAVLAVGTLGLCVMVVRQTGLQGLDFGEMSRSFSFGIRSYAARVAGHLHERVDVFMIAYLLDDAREVAFYAVGIALIGQLRVVPEAVTRALYPHLAGTEEAETANSAAMVSRHATFWVTASALAALASGPFVIPLVYGQAYTPTVLPFLVLLPGIVLFARYQVLANYFVSLGELRPVIIIQIANVFVNVPLNWILIPRWGITGAAFASSVSHGFAAICIGILFTRASGIGLGRTLRFRRADFEPYRRRLEALLRRRS